MEKKIQGQNRQKSKSCQNGIFYEPTVRTAEILADQYNVSPRTIIRDAKVAVGIDAIGEASSDAKRKILSGAAKVEKKKLDEISGESHKKIEEIASVIANGDYQRKKPVKMTPEEKTQPINMLISETRTFYSAINKLPANVDVKSMLRAHIDVLEDLYGRFS